MSPINLFCVLGVGALVFFAARGQGLAGLTRAGGQGRAYLRKHKKAVEEAKAKAIDQALEEAAARILGPVPSNEPLSAPPQTPPNG